MDIKILKLSDMLREEKLIQDLKYKNLSELAEEYDKSKQALSQKLSEIKYELIFQIREILQYEEFIIIENDVDRILSDWLSIYARGFFILNIVKNYMIVFRDRLKLNEFKEIYNNLKINDFTIPYDINAEHCTPLRKAAIMLFLEQFNPIRSLSGLYIMFTKLSFEENLKIFLKNHSESKVKFYFEPYKSDKMIYKTLSHYKLKTKIKSAVNKYRLEYKSKLSKYKSKKKLKPNIVVGTSTMSERQNKDVTQKPKISPKYVVKSKNKAKLKKMKDIFKIKIKTVKNV